MELKVVSKEIAIQLKELGFDWIPEEPGCLWLCGNKANEKFSRIKLITEKDCNNELFIAVCSMPTQSLVIKWLRDCKSIKIGIKYNWHYAKYQFRIGIVGSITTNIKFYDSYEDAEEKAIEKAIELLS